MSSTGQAAGGFYRIMTAKAHLWKTFRVPSSDRPHVSKAEIEADRENLKDSVFRIKHGAEWLTDAGDSMTSLEHVRALIESPPEHLPGLPVAFCDFAGPGDETVLTIANRNRAEIVDAWRSRDTMHCTRSANSWPISGVWAYKATTLAGMKATAISSWTAWPRKATTCKDSTTAKRPSEPRYTQTLRPNGGQRTASSSTQGRHHSQR